MLQVIKFGCPACGSILQIPLGGSGQQGPCPRCRQPIMAPDLATGAQARRLPVAAAPAPQPPAPAALRVIESEPPARYVLRLQPEPFTRPPAPAPFAEPEIVEENPAPVATPAPSHEPEPVATILHEIAPPPPEVPVAAPEPAPAIPEPSPASPQGKAGLATSLAIGTLASVLAFAGGYQAGRQRAVPAPVVKARVDAPAAAPKQETPPKPEPEKKAAPSPLTIAAAKASLEAFLAAQDWKTRLSHSLAAGRIGPKMKAYHATHPDGATPSVKIAVEHCEADDTTEQMLIIFRVCTAEAYDGYPVAVTETRDGWKVDWESFIEFRDELFEEFVSGKGEDTADFHLVVRPSSEPSLVKKQTPYDVTAPVNGKPRQVFVPMGTDLANKLAKLTNGVPFATLVLELARRPTAEGGTRIEIVSLRASDWRPEAR